MLITESNKYAIQIYGKVLNADSHKIYRNREAIKDRQRQRKKANYRSRMVQRVKGCKQK